MRVLGIDPGLARTGFGIVDGVGGRYQAVDYGVVTTAGEFPERLVQLYRSLAELVARHSPDALSIESVFQGPNVSSLVKLSHARAAAILAAGLKGLPVAEYTPMQIKRAVTGRGGADKTQVGFMVTRLLNLREPPKPLDASDALAAALCHLHRAVLAERIRT
ncbi:MAG: crossover junction endodeoxyribonuclease RuvC [Candidatus Delongbacteria bacterium]